MTWSAPCLCPQSAVTSTLTADVLKSASMLPVTHPVEASFSPSERLIGFCLTSANPPFSHQDSDMPFFSCPASSSSRRCGGPPRRRHREKGAEECTRVSSKRTPAFDVPDVRQACGFEEVVEVVDLERWSIIQDFFVLKGSRTSRLC